MTGNEFIDTLKIKLSFMRPADLDALVNFYEKKLLNAKSADEEEKIVAGFGDIEVLANSLRVQYAKIHPEMKEEPPSEKPADIPRPAPVPESEPAVRRESVRPAQRPAEQVRTAPPQRPVREKPKPEEARAEEEDVKIFRASDSGRAQAKSAPPKNEAPAKTQSGLVNTILDKMNATGKKRESARIALSIAFSPAFVVLALGILLLFCAAFIGIILASAVLVILGAALIVVSIAELIYAIIMFFSNIPVALIEFGLGTILIAFVTAITALIYQLLVGVIPLAMKEVNKLRKKAFGFFTQLFYGGKGGKQ